MESCVELTAASLEDPRLGDRLRAAPAEARVHLLRQADDLRLGGEAQRRLAAIVYGALHEDVDPAEPTGARRAAWFVGQVKRPDAASAPLVRAIAERATDAAVRRRATLLAADHAESAGDAPGGAHLLRRLLEDVRGTDERMEVAALLRLAQIAEGHGDPARALVFAARVLSRRPAVDAATHSAALLCRATAFADLRDAARCERDLLAAESSAGRLAPAAARSRNAEIAATRGRILLRRGQALAARPHLERALDAGSDVAQLHARRVHRLLAEMQFEVGRADRAAAHVARAAIRDDAPPADALEYESLRVRLQRVAGGAVAARQTALEVLESLETEGRRDGPRIDAACRSRVALDVADVLAEAQGNLSEPRRAWDAASAALTERAGSVERDLAADPDFVGIAADDSAALLEHRDRAAAGRAAIRATLRAYFEAAAQDTPAALVGALSVRGSDAAECAWCERVLTAQGVWVDPSRAEPAAPGSRAVRRRHAICDDCTGPVLRRAQAGRAGPERTPAASR